MTARTTIRSRATSVLLAGTLALGLTCAGGALGAEAGSSAVGDAAALGAALEQVESGSTGVTESQGVPSFTTVSQGGFSLQVSEDWVPVATEEEEGVTYSMLLGADGVLQIVTLGDGLPAADQDEATDEFMASLEEGGSFTDVVIAGTQDRKLDGTLIRDVGFTATMEGVSCEGLVTLAFGASDTAILTSVYVDDGTGGASFAFQQTHRSLAPLAGSGAREAAGSTPAGSSASAGTAASDSSTVTMGDFADAVDTDPADFTYATLTGTYNDAVEGTGVIGVPVTVTNVGTKTTSPDSWVVSSYGPDGLEQAGEVNYYVDDSLASLSGMRPGASVTAYVYMVDMGPGEYVLVFDDYAEQFEVPIEL